MVQKLDCPNTEREFRALLDTMYEISLESYQNGQRPCFKGLLEIIKSETVILSAIHKIKGNKGSKTPGTDGKTIEDILQMKHKEVISLFQAKLEHYVAMPVRRKWIPNPGKKEKRPLGIPNIEDRVIQECVRSVIEPILEAQFFKHSYGFRPMREASQALERISDLAHLTSYHWVVEGDISKFFDNINHTVLIKKLYNMGIRDQRVLMIIKQMLKAGVMNEIRRSELGTPQGGIISPILANVYLDSFDHWVNSLWEGKKTKHQYARQDGKISSLKRTNLTPAYLIRYADDWVILTNSHENALKLKYKAGQFLKDNLKLDLSFEKTKITNIRKRYMTFLGFDYKRVRGKSRTGFISRSRPDLKRLLDKIQGIKLDIYMIRKRDTYEKKIADIILVNSKIRGVLNYYKRATLISPIVKKYARALQYAGWNSLAPIGARWIPANKVDNLIGVHSRYQTAIPAIPILPQSKKDRQRLKLKRKNLGSEEKHLFIGITSLVFVRHEPGMIKFPSETPYSDVGRTIYFQRTGRKSALARADELRGLDNARTIAYRKMSAKKQKLYNFEFVMNRCYAFVRDKGKCRVCGQYLRVSETNTHHINPNLPINEVNKVNNLASVHIKCHNAIHSPDLDLSNLTSKELKKILTFRKKLEISKLN